jgi:hypothetical protein
MFNLTPDAVWFAFVDVLLCACDLFVPRLVRSGRHRQPVKFRPKQYPARVHKALVRKLSLWWRLRLQPGNLDLADSYRVAQDSCARFITECEASREQRIIYSNNLGAFYKFVNKKLACSSGVGSLFDKDRNLVTDDKAKADILNEYFASVCITDNNRQLDLPRAVQPNVCLSDVNFNPGLIVRAITMMKTNSSSGPDGLPSCVFKKLSASLSHPVSLIYTSFLSVGKIPNAWKSATVVPVNKKGIASEPSNYRP